MQHIDTIAATKRSAEELEVRSIASTTSSTRIDEEWRSLLSSSDTAQAWWDSGRPKIIRSTNRDQRTTDSLPETATLTHPAAVARSDRDSSNTRPAQPPCPYTGPQRTQQSRAYTNATTASNSHQTHTHTRQANIHPTQGSWNHVPFRASRF